MTLAPRELDNAVKPKPHLDVLSRNLKVEPPHIYHDDEELNWPGNSTFFLAFTRTKHLVLPFLKLIFIPYTPLCVSYIKS
jgi:hypothetical protein